jgi:hypothetical protein
MKFILGFFSFLLLNINLLCAQHSIDSVIYTVPSVFPRGIISGKVKSITVNEYHYVDGVLNNKKQKAVVLSFNKNKKNVKEEYITYLDNKVKESNIRNFKYDVHNNLSKEYSGNRNDTIYYFYDSKNNLILRKSIIFDSLYITLEQKYDGLNRLLEKKEGRIVCKYHYDGNSSNYKSFEAYRNGKLVQINFFEYDNWGNCTKESKTNYLQDGEQKEERVLKFDHSRQIYVKTSWGHESYTYYDSLGGVALRKFIKDSLIYEYKTVYDSLNNEKKVVEIHNGKPTNYFEFIYEFYN